VSVSVLLLGANGDSAQVNTISEAESLKHQFISFMREHAQCSFVGWMAEEDLEYSVKRSEYFDRPVITLVKSGDIPTRRQK
jgi:hypothetical protein